MKTVSRAFPFSFAALTALSGALAFACSDDDSDSSDDGSRAGAGGATAGRGGASGGRAGATAGAGGATAGTNASGGQGGAQETAALRVVHAAPGAPDVDLYAKGSATAFAKGLAYGEATEFLELPPGSYQVEVRAAGSAATTAPVFTTPAVALSGGGRYTAVAAGDIASTDADDRFRVLPLVEDFGTPAADSVRVRILHAGFDAPTVDINAGNDGGTPEVPGLERFESTPAAGIDLPADAELQIGIESEGDVVTAFTTPELPEGGELLVIATGELGRAARDELGFALLGVLPDSTTVWIKQNPRVHALHASPDAGSVDIFAGDTELVDSAAFGDLATVQVPPGEYTLDFFAAEAGASERPAGDAAASADTPELEAGENYLAIAAGELTAATPTFELLPLVDAFNLETDGDALVRVVHASADAPAVDLGTVATSGTLQTPPVLQDLAFGDDSAAAGLPLPAEQLTLGLAATGTTATAAEFTLTPAADQRLFAVAAGAFSPPGSAFRLLLVDATTVPWSVSEVLPD